MCIYQAEPNVEIMVLGGQAVQVIKKVKKEDEIQLTTSESEFVNAVNSEEDLQTVPEKSEENLQITSEEAVMLSTMKLRFMNQEQLMNSFFR